MRLSLLLCFIFLAACSQDQNFGSEMSAADALQSGEAVEIVDSYGELLEDPVVEYDAGLDGGDSTDRQQPTDTDGETNSGDSNNPTVPVNELFENPELNDLVACGNNGKKIYVCHFPPGNPENAHTLCVARQGFENGLSNIGQNFAGRCEDL